MMSLKAFTLTSMFLFFSLSLFFGRIVCPPVVPGANVSGNIPEPIVENGKTVNETVETDPILALEYHRYLREIVNVLETDPVFKSRIENASVEEIKSGKIANNLEFVNHNIRTKLDELKRKEIERLRQLISRKAMLNNMKPSDIENLLPKHLDHNNVETFETNDLEKLIRQATVDLEEVDKLRREEFKQHEIEKEYERRQKLQELDPEARKKAEAEFQANMDKRKHHERVNHPGSRDQLEEVWEEQDHLEPEQFDAETFFNLHDLDGNNYLDEFETEALFQNELDKIFNTSDPLYDPRERDEEANRMRQHVFSEIDKNKDMMISKEEFIDATKQKEFKNNEEWKSIEDEPQFSQQEFENYSKAHMGEEHPPTPHTPVHPSQPTPPPPPAPQAQQQVPGH